MSERRGNFMQTYTGRRYWPLDPRASEVDIIDIAHSLAMQCRYTGHTLRFYSVAEHSWHVSHIVPPEHALAGLLHDAAEAYVTDVARPVKRHLVNYAEIEHLNWLVISARFGLSDKLPECVIQADHAMIHAEKPVLMAPMESEGWFMDADKVAPANVTIRAWEPREAKQRFLYRFQELTEAR